MRDLVITENITLDGVIEAVDGWFTPADDSDDDDLLAVQRDHMHGADAVLLGRVTFEEFRGYWPQQTDDPSGVADYLNRTTKYVVTSGLTDPGWENTTVLSGPVDADVAALKDSPGAAIVATGSVRLVQELVRAGLADEYRLFVYPVVLGHGRRLFAEPGRRPRLHLVEVRPFRSGVVLMRYRTGESTA